MLVDIEIASAAFESLAINSRCPSVSPEYAVIDATRSPVAEAMSWLYREEGNFYLYSFHRQPIPGTDWFDIESPYPYGGPVTNLEDPAFIDRANVSFHEWCQRNSIVVEFVRFHPMLQNSRFFRGRVFDDRPTVWVDLEVSDLLASYQTRVRTAIRKAQRIGLEVQWSKSEDRASDFFRMYSDSMAALGADSFYSFSRSYFSALMEWPNSELGLCRNGDHLIGAALFLAGGMFMEYHLSCSDKEGKRLGASNTLLHEAALRARGIGLKKLYLGGGTDSGRDNSLLFFKSGFSDSRAMFQFGGRVHNPAAYEALKQRYSAAYASRPARVLFYR